MLHLGRIEPRSPSVAIDRDKWIDLVRSHSSLSPVPPRKGINPLTREPIEVKAPGTSARVMIGGADLGSIYWAMDDSPMLIVAAEDGAAERIVEVAEGIARTLGARFVREADDGRYS